MRRDTAEISRQEWDLGSTAAPWETAEGYSDLVRVRVRAGARVRVRFGVRFGIRVRVRVRAGYSDLRRALAWSALPG